MQARKEWWEGEKLRGKPLPNNARFCEHLRGSVNTVSVMAELKILMWIDLKFRCTISV